MVLRWKHGEHVEYVNGESIQIQREILNIQEKIKDTSKFGERKKSGHMKGS